MSTNNFFTPGTEIDPVSSYTTSSQKITLDSPSSRPLSPSITASSTGTGSSREILVSCIVFISEENMPKNNEGGIDFNTPINFNIYGLVTDVKKMVFYVSNNVSFSSSENFYPFVVPIKFSPSQITNLSNNCNSVKVINWDADPDGSRGTEIDIPE